LSYFGIISKLPTAVVGTSALLSGCASQFEPEIQERFNDGIFPPDRLDPTNQLPSIIVTAVIFGIPALRYGVRRLQKGAPIEDRWRNVRIGLNGSIVAANAYFQWGHHFPSCFWPSIIATGLTVFIEHSRSRLQANRPQLGA